MLGIRELPGCERVGPFTQDWNAYWVRAEDAALAQRFDDWLIAQEASGRLAGWRSTWFGAAEVPATATPRLALRAAEEERLALMPFVAGIKRAKGLAVVDRAREQRVLDAAWTAVQAAARELALETPSRVEVESFYRRQIEAAVALQEEVIEAPEDSSLARFDLAGELRPALLRIGDRMARLLVRVANEAPGSAGSPDARGARMMEP